MESEKLTEWLKRLDAPAEQPDEEMEFLLYEMRVTDSPSIGRTA